MSCSWRRPAVLTMTPSLEIQIKRVLLSAWTMVKGFILQNQDSVSVAILSSAWLTNWDKTVYQTRQSTWSLFVWRSRTQIWDGLTCWQSRSLGGPGGYLSAERTPDTKTQSCLTPALLTSIAPVLQNRLVQCRQWIILVVKVYEKCAAIFFGIFAPGGEGTRHQDGDSKSGLRIPCWG